MQGKLKRKGLAFILALSMMVPVSYVPEAKAAELQVYLSEKFQISNMEKMICDDIELADRDTLLEGYIEEKAEEISGKEIDITDGEEVTPVSVDEYAFEEFEDKTISSKSIKKCFADRALYGSYEENNTHIVKRGSFLTGCTLQIYNALVDKISDIAAGDETSTMVTIPVEALNNISVDTSEIYSGNAPIIQ
ncbi:MAG: hypothetical protein II915_05015, partial [Eubacterium sp.]|nr:hypothetical protein [Eubacterium sp.]